MGATSGIYNNKNSSRWAVITTVPLVTITAPINALLRFSILFVIGAAITMVFVVLATSRSLAQRAKSLQRDLEQASTMQDNLKYGLFLMDGKYIMQGAYSKALEKILAVSNLKGKNFIELLTSSIKKQEKDGLADYFDMILKKSFDKNMLDSINPINEFTYINSEVAEIKNLRTSFTLAEKGRGTDLILGTIEDITSEKELEKQLIEAENIRENEMRSLFQVIQLDPRVLSDFVADAEYEFDRINEMLKSKKQMHRELLVEMYQSVHAVKSNALILNLDSFSDRLHKLEASVKNLQEKPGDVVPFDDFLELMFEIDEAMKEIDDLKSTVSKIENFRSISGGSKTQERYVLIETLNRVCIKTQTALDKKARLVVEDIDEVVLNYGPRRAIKEVLTQLVRNAVYHGIETPKDREKAGKEPEGEIRISITNRSNQIYITLSDNGNGIDFGKIRKKAVESKMLHNPAIEGKDKNTLLKVIFSETGTQESSEIFWQAVILITMNLNL
jgi:two-component system chemotaxis sensor kinase CheA